MATRAYVTKVDTTGVYVRVPELALGVHDFGPCESLVGTLTPGDRVVVDQSSRAGEDLVVIGKIGGIPGYDDTALRGRVTTLEGDVATLQAKPDTTWDTLQGKPTVYPPAAHTHSVADLIDGGTLATDAELSSAVSAINTSLNGKASVTHTHVSGDITDATALGRNILGAADAGSAPTTATAPTAMSVIIFLNILLASPIVIMPIVYA